MANLHAMITSILGMFVLLAQLLLASLLWLPIALVSLSDISISVPDVGFKADAIQVRQKSYNHFRCQFRAAHVGALFSP